MLTKKYIDEKENNFKKTLHDVKLFSEGLLMGVGFVVGLILGVNIRR